MNSRQIIIALFTGGMTFSWMIVWASFITAPVTGVLFSNWVALAAIILAATVAAGVRRYRLRNYQTIGLHLVGLTTVLACSIHTSFFPSENIFNNMWLGALASEVSQLGGFLSVFLVAACTMAFWLAGEKLGRKFLNYLSVCNRFDLGLTSLFALLLIQLILVTRGGLSISAPPDAFYIYCFFLCGLSAIGLARHRGKADRKFLPGIRGIAALLFIAAVMLSATGMMAVFAPPVLTPMAEDGYVVVKAIARPLGLMITRFLLFIFRRDGDYPVERGGTAGSPGELLPEVTQPWGFWFTQLMAEVLIGLMILVVMVLFGIALWRIIRWLLLRSEGPELRPNQRSSWYEFLSGIWSWLQYRWQALTLRFTGPVHIGRLFAALQSWGQSGGVPRHQWETPEEYANRLGARFPQLNDDIHTIVSDYQYSFYGGKTLDFESLSDSYTAWRRLKSPQHWASRWRALFDRPI